MSIVREVKLSLNGLPEISAIRLMRDEEDRFPFQFGLSRARLIIDSIEEIKAWVEKQDALLKGGE